MRKATLVLATSVAFLFSGAAFAVTGSRTVNPTSASDLYSAGSFVNDAGVLKVQSPVSGTYIPAGTSASQEVSVPVKTIATVNKGKVAATVRAAVKSAPGSIIASAALNAAVEAVGGLIEDGQVVRKNSSAASGEFYQANDSYGPDQKSACDTAAKGWFGGTTGEYRQNFPSQGSDACIFQSGGYVSITKTQCPSGNYMDFGKQRCVSGTPPATSTPWTEGDYNDLGTWVQGQDGTWIKEGARESCMILGGPACLDNTLDDKIISGPSTITGAPTTTTKTVSTTNPDGSVTTGTATTTTTPGASVTYNNNTTNNIQYNTYEKTVTKNPDGSTTETNTDEGMPDVPDWLTPSLKPLKDLPDIIKNQGPEGSSVPYTSWFDLGGGKCKEIEFDLPVIGHVSSTFCDMYYKYVHPALYFLFSVWTWHSCFQIFRESATRVRAK